MENLADCWEWDRITGDPVFHHPPRVWNWRYIPSVAEMPSVVYGLLEIDPVRATELVSFMHSDDIRTFFHFDTRNSGNPVRSFLALIRALNLKKVAVKYHGSGRLQMDKLRRDQPFTDGEHQLWIADRIRFSDFEGDINRNALVGFLGPGTFACHHPRCDLCARTGRSATVNLGAHGVLQLTKRATCSTRNVVYVGVCSRCQELGGDDDWCVYFGETSQTFRKRCSQHVSDPCNSASVLKHRCRTAVAKRAEIERIINEGVDTDGILQDWYPHVCTGGIHEGFQRMSVVDVLPLYLQRIHRETGLVLHWMMRNGAIDYRGMGRGCVNTYHDDRV